MTKKSDSVKWIECINKSEKCDKAIQTLEYMLQRIPYNFEQQEALSISLDTLKYIKEMNREDLTSLKSKQQ